MFLSKTQWIYAKESQLLQQWIMNSYFATYAWGTSPMDATDLIRSYFAKARIFLFPLELNDEKPPRIPKGQGQAALERWHMVVTLIEHQRALLKCLVEDRRERHRQIKNANRQQRFSEVGEIVI